MERLEQEILKTLKKAKGPISLAELMRRLGLKSAHRRQLRATLRGLIDDRKVRPLSNKHYALPVERGKQSLVEGRLQITIQGFGFVRPTGERAQGRDEPQDIFIRAGDLHDAMDGDLVAVQVTAPAQGDRNPTGQIQAILERAHAELTGWFQRSSSRRGLVTPRNPKIGRVVEVRKKPDTGWPEDFSWVVVHVTEFTSAPQPLVGEIVEELGDDQTRGIDVLLMLRDRGIYAEFPKDVEDEAAHLSTDWKTELPRRTDFREHAIVTIDPETAKDFDDALSIEQLGGKGGKRWILRVHIADVSHYVKEGGTIDREAWHRATSIYPVDRVVPMLPERLSTDLCSLRPGEDRPAMTVEIEVDANGDMVRTAFYRSVIHSRHRLTYDQVQALFNGSDATLKARLSDVVEPLNQLRDLARVLRRRRLRQGALDLDIPEPQVVFDAQGRAVDIRYYPRFESHQLVEECMLLANEAVAIHLTKLQWPMLYRIHETAQPRQLKQLEPMLRALGIRVNFKQGNLTPKAIQRALDQAEKRPAGHIFRRLILRALSRARYSPENLGHFGLASDCYCHFTSPIRRYPDLVVHRMLIRHLEGNEPPRGDDRKALMDELAETGEQSSAMERVAQEIEWDTTKLKSLEYMQKHIGEEFDGHVAGVQPFGLFMELEDYPVEGLIPVGSLPYDRYQVDDLGVRLVGKRRGRQYQLADKIRVIITNIDLTALEMDLKPAKS